MILSNHSFRLLRRTIARNMELTDPVESKALRTVYHRIHTGISSSLEATVSLAYSERLVSEHVNRSASYAQKDRDSRTTEFLEAVQKRVRVDPPAFDIFVKVLSQEPAHQYLVDALTEERAKEVEHAKLRKESLGLPAATFRAVPTTTMRTSPVIERPLKTNVPYPFLSTERELITSSLSGSKVEEQQRRKAFSTGPGRSPAFRHTLTAPLLTVSCEDLHALQAKTKQPADSKRSRLKARNSDLEARAAALPEVKSNHVRACAERKSEPATLSPADFTVQGESVAAPSIKHTAPTPTASLPTDPGENDDSNDLKTVGELQYLSAPRSRQTSIDSLSSASSEEEYYSAQSSINSLKLNQPIQESSKQQLQCAVVEVTAASFRASIGVEQSHERQLLDKANKEIAQRKEREEILLREQDRLQKKVQDLKERNREIHRRLLETQGALTSATEKVITLQSENRELKHEVEVHKVKSCAFNYVLKSDELEKRVHVLEGALNQVQFGFVDSLSPESYSVQY